MTDPPLAAADPSAVSLQDLWNQYVMPVLGPIILVGTLFFGVLVLAPLAYVWNTILEFLGISTVPAISGAPVATVEPDMTVAATLTNDSLLDNSSPVTDATADPADDELTGETGGGDVSRLVASTDSEISTGSPTETESVTVTEPGTGIEQVLTETVANEPVVSLEPETGNDPMSADTVMTAKDVPETVEGEKASTLPVATSALEPSAGAPTSDPGKPARRVAPHRPVAGDSPAVGKRLRDIPHRSNGGHSITRSGAADGKSVTGAASVSSPRAASSPAGGHSAGRSASGSNSSGSNASGGDAGES